MYGRVVVATHRSKGGAMPWIWTDVLARMLLDAGLVTSLQVQEWLDRPQALAMKEEDDALVVGVELLGTAHRVQGAA